MNKHLQHILVILLLLCSRLGIAQPVPVHHSYSEILSELTEMSESYPDYIRIDTLTRTDYYDLPVVMAKISTNPDRVESKPALLFIGQVHAEEIIGVELTLHLMQRLLNEMNENEAMRTRVEGLELYFIPTLNPDGLSVISSGRDIAYRKNCRDNIGDGELRVVSGVGRDTSGVDLNRNFGLHWDRGDPLFFNGGAGDAYNYYRGPAPFSEPETQALRDLMLDRRFLFAISYHSSRSGRNAELVIGPWSWDGRLPPDDAVIQNLGAALAFRLPSESGEGSYINVRATQQVGQEQDWAYQATGTLMYMVELGQTVNPDSALLANLIDDATPSALFLMDIAVEEQSIASHGLLAVHVVDAVSGQPVPAEVNLGPSRSPLLEPRLAVTENGRWEQYQRSGYYALLVRAPGYVEQQFDSVLVPNGFRNNLQLALQPKPRCEVCLNLTDQAAVAFVPGRVMIKPADSDAVTDIEISDEQILNLYEGSYLLTVIASGYVPVEHSIEISCDTTISIPLAIGEEQYVEDFSIFGNWQSGGGGAQWGIIDGLDRTCLTESLWDEYPANCNAWLMLETGVVPEPNHTMTLQLIHRPNFEPGADLAAVEVYLPYTMEWMRIGQFSSFPREEFDTSYISLTGLPIDGREVRFRLWVMSDAAVQEDGWLVDRISLYYSDEATSVESSSPLPTSVSLAAYPNPSNGALTIYLTLPTSQAGALILHDQSGRQVSLIDERLFPPGQQHLVFDASHLSSGTYYLSLNAPGNAGALAPAIPVVILK